MRRIALLVAATATGWLLAGQPALAGTVSACAPSGQAAALGPHAFAQPFTLAVESDIATVHVWLGGSVSASAHLTVQPLVPRIATDPTSPLVPSQGTPLIALDVSPTSATVTDAALPLHLGHLPAGSYALVVEATGDLALGGCVGPPFALYQSDGRWRPVPIDAGFALVLDGGAADHAPPVVTIEPIVPNPSNAAQLAIAFSADEPATFLCSLDGAPGTRCTSPYDTTPLTEGRHAVAIDATDGWGNATPAPAVASFVIDRSAPSTRATIDPPRAGDRHATIHLAASEQGATFTCALDGGPATPCTSGGQLLIADEGHHTLHAVATDVAGNADPVGADATFLADWTAPVLNDLSDVTRAATSVAGAAVTWVATATDALDPDPIVLCTPASGHLFTVGDTTVTCRATDVSGNAARGGFVVHVTAPPITSAEVDVAYDASTDTFVWSEPDGGTIGVGPDGSTVASASGHETVVRTARASREDEERSDQRRLTIRSLGYDGAAAASPGRNRYRVRLLHDDRGSITAIRIIVRTADVSVTVRYDAASDTSTVTTRRAGGTRVVTRVAGLAVPHLRSDRGALLVLMPRA